MDATIADGTIAERSPAGSPGEPDVYGRPPWKVRRRIVHGTLIFLALVIAWLVVRGEDSELNQTIATSSFLFAAAVIGSYVFGAIWDDRNVMTLLGPKAYQDQVPPP